jgi:hypothetical protein
MDGGQLMPNARAQLEIASQRTAARFPYLIKITHPDYPDMFFANSSQDITYKSDIYNAATFSVQPPDRDGSKIGDATLTMSAIDQVWIEKIRGTQKPAKLQFIAVIVYDQGSTIGIEPLEENSFTLRAASWNELAITWNMVFDEVQSILIPSDLCNAQTAPGCS